MTTPARLREADAVGVAFQLALANMGAATIEEALDHWDDVPINATAQQIEKWLATAVQMILTRRSLSRELGVAYYRLIRALRTGRTTPAPWEPEIPKYVTLAQLRREFRLLAEQTEENAPALVAGRSYTSAYEAGSWTPGTDDDQIAVDPELADAANGDDETERSAEKEAKITLDVVGPKTLDKKLREIDTGKPARDVDREREEARQQSGLNAALHAERIVKNAARNYVYTTSHTDRRAIGYVRVTDGDPCSWCAMLASRGLVLYRSKEIAELGDEGDKYHPNCNCHAEPVFSVEHYETSEKLAVNRALSQEWKDVIHGDGGVDEADWLDPSAINVWRRHMNRKKRATRSRS